MTPASTPRADTRARILAASNELFRRNGYAGTALKEILEASEAPSGSLYHFFPTGKEELGAASIRSGGDAYLGLVELVFAEGADVVEATSEFFEGAALIVESTDYADACPVASVALEVSNTSESMRIAAAAAFDSWLQVLEHRFRSSGINRESSHDLAIELFCAVEGAFLLARVTRNADPIRIAGRAARQSVEATLSRSRKA